MSEERQRTFNITGMSCEHCVAAVTAELGEVPGVSGVEVDLASGVAIVHGHGFTEEAVGSAVEAAGYELAGTRTGPAPVSRDA